MFWNKKENKGLPDLPPMRAFPSGPQSSRLPSLPPRFDDDISKEDDEAAEKQSLPSFPDSPMNKGFSQAAIKDAISTEDDQETSSPMPSKNFKTVEMEEWTPEPSPQPVQKYEPPPIPMIPKYTPPIAQKPLSKNQDIFVKIDRFHAARRALEEAKNKLESIDELLKRIRETKLREEQELTSWEKELMAIKSRVQEVNDNVFEKLD